MSRTITKSEVAMHLKTAPRTFQTQDAYRQSGRIMENMLHEAEGLTKKDAIRLAQLLLVHVYSSGIGFQDMESPTGATRHVGAAIRELRGLS